MAISKTRYVLITSGVGGAAAAGRRELIARVMTTNTLAPTLGVLEFGGGASAALLNVGNYFGTTSNEYAFASKYFGFVSKDVRQADKISFARYTPSATAPQLISKTIGALASLQAISDGSFTLSMGGVSTSLTGIDLTDDSSYTDIAATLQTAIRSYTAGGTLWTSATVSFTSGNFVLTGGETGAAVITAATTAASGTDISTLIGWSVASSPIVSEGCDAESLTTALDRISNTSNNFGSFCFAETLSTADVAEVGTWTNAQNVAYVFSHAVTAANASTIQAEVNGNEGVCLTLDAFADNAQYMPMAVGACINYNRVGAATNFMFEQFPNDTASVTTDTGADTYDALKVNYLGATQQAGKNIAFYQRGVLQGNISDIGVYWNEMWLKDAISTEFLNLLLALKQLPANADGSNTARAVLSSVLVEAQNNGVIQSGKTLTTVQKAYITSLTGDNEAWREVEQNGYYLTVSISSYVNANNGLTEYQVDYQLIYGKGDSIRKVVGSDILI